MEVKKIVDDKKICFYCKTKYHQVNKSSICENCHDILVQYQSVCCGLTKKGGVYVVLPEQLNNINSVETKKESVNSKSGNNHLFWISIVSILGVVGFVLIRKK